MSGCLPIYGGPHGGWRPLFRACAEHPPDPVLLLCDLELDMPLGSRLAPGFEAGIEVRRIRGSHTSHRQGFAGVDGAARLRGADLVAHGHGQTARDGCIERCGTAVQGLGRAEVLRIGREWFQ